MLCRSAAIHRVGVLVRVIYALLDRAVSDVAPSVASRAPQTQAAVEPQASRAERHPPPPIVMQAGDASQVYNIHHAWATADTCKRPLLESEAEIEAAAALRLWRRSGNGLVACSASVAYLEIQFRSFGVLKVGSAICSLER